MALTHTQALQLLSQIFMFWENKPFIYVPARFASPKKFTHISIINFTIMINSALFINFSHPEALIHIKLPDTRAYVGYNLKTVYDSFCMLSSTVSWWLSVFAAKTIPLFVFTKKAHHQQQAFTKMLKKSTKIIFALCFKKLSTLSAKIFIILAHLMKDSVCSA